MSLIKWRVRVLKKHSVGAFTAEVFVIILHQGSEKFTENLPNLGN